MRESTEGGSGWEAVERGKDLGGKGGGGGLWRRRGEEEKMEGEDRTIIYEVLRGGDEEWLKAMQDEDI